MGLVVGVLVAIAATPPLFSVDLAGDSQSLPARSGDEVRRAVSAVYADDGLQRDLPAPAPPRDPPPRSDGDGFGTIATIVLWVAVIAVVLLLIAWAINELILGPRAPPDEVIDDPIAAETAAGRAALDAPRVDAEALAAAGRYAEAVHALLFQTLDELVRAGTRAIPAALTAREICGRVPMPDLARGELSGLVSAVEVSHFGGRAPTADDYATCRQRFDRFVASYRGDA